jgi:hypothetical protein
MIVSSNLEYMLHFAPLVTNNKKKVHAAWRTALVAAVAGSASCIGCIVV